ncbi:uncharacterized aarF domain-containing protein kinase 1 isoform X5 [Durio zibethinus]|uniref:Uncharacterized aarF domain-containing protein kinase 1 isoform X5 n=1 Tax=Durio zibethinus TaxID=66656 RepID=A0A6P6A306_DURZI|nr:uncharacterized aarF domain-containing protein kinase 1 isoform X5 [Durio zibethinus]
MIKQIVSKFPAQAKAAFCLITVSGISYQANCLSSSDSSVFQGVLRSSRAIFTIAVTVADYKYSLYGLPKDCDEYRRLLSEVHLRSAKRILKLCETNKGFYVKAGQFVSSLRQVPKDYSLTLSSLQDQAVPCDFKVIKEAIISNLGQDLSELCFLNIGFGGWSQNSLRQFLWSLVDDVEFLKGMKINPEKVAKVLVEVFAEMIFIHGFLHGDPHPGNILVSPEGPGGFSLVLLDHGICKKLDEEFRLEYCQLWKALILLDSKKIQHLGERFGVGKYSRYLPIIFSGRTIDSKSGLGKGMLVEEQKKLKQDLKTLKMEDISLFMESLPSNFLTILRADELLRSLISKLGASKRVRLLTYGKYASLGLSPKLNPSPDFKLAVLYTKLIGNIQYIHLRFALGVMELVLWMGNLKQHLNNFYRKISGAGKGLLTLLFNLEL